MSAPTVVARGKAVVEGCAGTFDAILYAVTQDAEITQNFEKEDGKDVHGYDGWWVFRNEHGIISCNMKLVGDTEAHKVIPATAVSTTAAVSSLGQPFLAPGTTLTLSGFSPSAFNGVFQLQSGCKCAIKNAQVADLSLNMLKYANADQNTAMATIPS